MARDSPTVLWGAGEVVGDGRHGKPGGFGSGRRLQSGGVETDLDGFVEEIAERLGAGDGVTAKGFEKEPCQIAERAEGSFDVALSAAVAFEHLALDVCRLEQQVEVLGGRGSLGVGVLHREAPVLLRAKALVLSFPAFSSSFLCEGMTGFGRDCDVGHPGEAMVSIGVGEAAFQDVEFVRSAGDVIDPGVVIGDVVDDDSLAVLWDEFPQSLEFVPDRRQDALLFRGRRALRVRAAHRRFWRRAS